MRVVYLFPLTYTPYRHIWQYGAPLHRHRAHRRSPRWPDTGPKGGCGLNHLKNHLISRLSEGELVPYCNPIIRTYRCTYPDWRWRCTHNKLWIMEMKAKQSNVEQNKLKWKYSRDWKRFTLFLVLPEHNFDFSLSEDKKAIWFISSVSYFLYNKKWRFLNIDKIIFRTPVQCSSARTN